MCRFMNERVDVSLLIYLFQRCIVFDYVDYIFVYVFASSTSANELGHPYEHTVHRS